MCPGAVDNASTFAIGRYTDDRTPEWWEDRRLVKDFGAIEAAVLVQHGQWEEGHRYQEAGP